MFMKKVLGNLVGVVLMVGNCVGSEIDSSVEDCEIPAVLKKLPMFECKVLDNKFEFTYTPDSVWSDKYEELSDEEITEIAKLVDPTTLYNAYGNLFEDLKYGWLGLEAPVQDCVVNLRVEISSDMMSKFGKLF